MSRLIDADVYKKQICSSCIEKTKYRNLCPCGRVIDLDLQPTAYDVDAVLHELSLNVEDCTTTNTIFNTHIYVGSVRLLTL